MTEGNGTPKFIVAPSIPIPRPMRGKLIPKEAVYPWAQMKVGSSFFVPCAKGKGFSAHQGRRRSHPAEKYEMRRVVEDGTDGFRIWRTA